MKKIIEKREGVYDARPILDVLSKGADGYYEFEITIRKRPRSNDQNKWLWGCIYPMLLYGLNDAGWEFTSTEQVHEYFKQTLLKQSVVNRFTGEIVEFPSDTHSMNTVQFSTYCEKLREYGSEYLGIDIPDPR